MKTNVSWLLGPCFRRNDEAGNVGGCGWRFTERVWISLTLSPCGLRSAGAAQLCAGASMAQSSLRSSSHNPQTSQQTSTTPRTKKHRSPNRDCGVNFFTSPASKHQKLLSAVILDAGCSQPCQTVLVNRALPGEVFLNCQRISTTSVLKA